MSASEQAFQQVIEQPEPDAPRLSYAAVAPEPRSSFVRTQVELAKMRRAFDHAPEWQALYDREQELLRAHAEEWSTSVKRVVDSARFRRGFVEDVTMAAGAFLERAQEMYQLAPVLHLNLTGVKAVASKLFASPHLGRIHSLSLRNNGLDDGDAAALASSPHLGNLRWLDLNNNAIGTAGLDSLAASKQLPRLKYLSFRVNSAPDPTPQTGGVEESGRINDWDYPPLGKELQAKHGAKPWLSFAINSTDFYPPPRDSFS